MRHSPEIEELMDSRLFRRVLDTWARMADIVYGDRAPAAGSLMRAHGIKYLTRYLTAGSILAVENNDPEYPWFERWADQAWSWGIDNPDGNYEFAAVNDTDTYRIYGRRGTAHQFDVQVHAPHFCEHPNHRVIANINFEQLEVEDDGSVEIIVSPEPHGGNWLQSRPGTQSLCIRQFFYDWENEVPADLTIERVGATYPPAPEPPERTIEKYELLMRWLEHGAKFMDDMAHWCLDAKPNSSPFLDPGLSEWGGHRGLSYGMGNFQCQPDEAVILEVVPPDCHYWGFQVASWFWESLDWWRRQTSLNGHQAEVDGDGVFRCVISHRDPGVYNWLDTAGYTWGPLNGRWLLTDAWPEPEMRLVPFDDIDKHVPPSTRRVTPEERSEILRRRQYYAQRLVGF